MTDPAVVPLPRASHIKPWARRESDWERLDPFNGLLLSPDLDAAFDAGYITFDDDGTIVVGRELRDAAARFLPPGSRLRRIDDPHRRYLAYHRKHLIRGSEPGPPAGASG